MTWFNFQNLCVIFSSLYVWIRAILRVESDVYLEENTISMEDGLWTEPHVHMTSEVYTDKNNEHLQWAKFQWQAQQCYGSFKTTQNALLIRTPVKCNADLLLETIWTGNLVTETGWLTHNETNITKKLYFLPTMIKIKRLYHLSELTT